MLGRLVLGHLLVFQTASHHVVHVQIGWAILDCLLIAIPLSLAVNAYSIRLVFDQYLNESQKVLALFVQVVPVRHFGLHGLKGLAKCSLCDYVLLDLPALPEGVVDRRLDFGRGVLEVNIIEVLQVVHKVVHVQFGQGGELSSLFGLVAIVAVQGTLYLLLVRWLFHACRFRRPGDSRV